jgi:hypothetical protein
VGRPATHGVSSEREIRPLARNYRRRVLRQFGVRASDLSPVAKAYIDQIVRLRTKIDLIDAYLAEHGMIRPDGNAQPVLRLYGTLENSLRLAVNRLEENLRVRKRDPRAELDAYLAAGPDEAE